jgi:hypothetical protein
MTVAGNYGKNYGFRIAENNLHYIVSVKVDRSDESMQGNNAGIA